MVYRAAIPAGPAAAKPKQAAADGPQTRAPEAWWTSTRPRARFVRIGILSTCWRDLDLNLVRKFVVNRMLGVRCTGLRFKRPTDFNPDEFLRKSFGAMTGTEDYEVIVVFDAWATDTMRGRQWHTDQVVAELADGRAVFCVRVSCLEEIERWVLSWGNHARVIEPRELVDRVLETMAKAEAGYRAGC